MVLDTDRHRSSMEKNKTRCGGDNRSSSVTTVMRGFILIYVLCAISASCRVDAADNEETTTVAVDLTTLEPTTPDTITTPETIAKPDTGFRLSPEVKPLTYGIHLHPHLNNGTFSGRVLIQIDVLSKQNLIKLHQKDLKIGKVELKNSAGDAVEIVESSSDNESESLLVKLKDEIEAGRYDLSLEFDGGLDGKIVGFYSSRYRDEYNATRVIATTQFEPTHARKAFPCFDEPSFKAEFSIELVHPSAEGYGALSNMNVENVTADSPSAGYTTVSFAKTVPMSTYLACFIVSDFVSTTKQAKRLDGSEFPVSVYTSRAQRDKGALALDAGVKLIEYYNTLFGVEFPLPKMDMAAIPDFAYGAMENWGMVTYRETLLLYDNETSSTADKQAITHVIAHEFGHMWFGNLVTMKWWNDLWLNEGFATFAQYKSSHEVFPDGGFMDLFLHEVVHQALGLDAKLSSHPIVQAVNTPDEISSLTDTISYQKGASVIKMLQNFVGSDTFFTGVTNYFKKFMYKNAETKDLFDSIQAAADNKVDVNAIMDTWTRQMGYPVVKINKQKQTYKLTQKRFLENSGSKFNASETPFGYKWTIPVTYTTDKNSTPTLVWFDKDAESVAIQLNEAVNWIKFNANQTGFYRVNYGSNEWRDLINILRKNPTELSSHDRANLLEDAFSLANAGELDYSVALTLSLYLNNEKSYVPWHVVLSKMKTINNLLSSTKTSKKLHDFVRKLIHDVYNEVTWEIGVDEPTNKLKLRTTILNLACSIGYQKCLQEAGTFFKSWIEDKNDVRPHPDLRSLVYHYGMKSIGTESEWNVMLERFVAETDAAEKKKLMQGLAGTSSEKLLKKYIEIALDENYVRSQDTFTCLQYIAENSKGTDLVWSWVRENWEMLVKRFTINSLQLGKMIPSITSSFSTKSKLDEMKTFFEKYPKAGAGKASRKQALETVGNNLKWIESYKAKIDRWLNSRSRVFKKFRNLKSPIDNTFFA